MGGGINGVGVAGCCQACCWGEGNERGGVGLKNMVGVAMENLCLGWGKGLEVRWVRVGGWLIL